MELIAHSAAYAEPHFEEPQAQGESRSSGASWGAVIAGAFVAAAFYLVLLALGAGFELSSVSPWSNVSTSASRVGALGIAWLVFIEIVASALGGYLTGRLRTKWVAVHTDEVYFRDTANGFLSWAVALVISVTLLSSAAASMVGKIQLADRSTDAASASVPNAYFVDQLFRPSRPGMEPVDAATQAEATRILRNGLQQDQIPPADLSYLSQLVVSKAGTSQPEADKRVTQVTTDARQAEDSARKATSHLLFWMFIALMSGAFSASLAATIGGRQRDHMKAI